MPSKSMGTGGWLSPQNILSRHIEKYLHGMVLKLTEHVRNTISLLYKQKTGWNSDIWNFFRKKSILAYISLKINIFRSAILYYVIVTSYVDRFSWFWYQWKEETLPYTMVPNNCTLGMSISNSQGGGNHTPLGRRVTKKKKKKSSGRRGISLVYENGDKTC